MGEPETAAPPSPTTTLPQGWRLDGQVALVTGAAGGLGRGICGTLAALGAHIVLGELPEQVAEAEALGRELHQEHGVPTTAVALDVTDVAGTRQAIDGIVETAGRLDILIANAGIIIRQPALEVTEDAWDRVLAVDLKGVFFCCQAAGRHMVRQGYGRIVNVASQNGVVGYFERAAYCAAKGGVVNLTKVLALEWATKGVRVNAVGPTFVSTALTEGTLADPAIREDLLRRIPIGRLGTVDEVAAAVAFLASPAAELITGHTLLVDGGWTAV